MFFVSSSTCTWWGRDAAGKQSYDQRAVSQYFFREFAVEQVVIGQECTHLFVHVDALCPQYMIIDFKANYKGENIGYI